jgi:energy-converting hydrogenase Eha subunit F
MDKESIIFGLVLSLTAQGLYDALLYGFSGKTIEENGAVFAAFVTVTFILLAFEIITNFRKDVRRRIVKHISKRLKINVANDIE